MYLVISVSRTGEGRPRRMQRLSYALRKCTEYAGVRSKVGGRRGGSVERRGQTRRAVSNPNVWRRDRGRVVLQVLCTLHSKYSRTP